MIIRYNSKEELEVVVQHDTNVHGYQDSTEFRKRIIIEFK